MTRRAFSIAVAGVAAIPRAAPQVVILQAIAGERLPQTLSITTNFPQQLRQGLWELRTYRTSDSNALAGKFAGVFRRAGIRPRLQRADRSELTYLIPFESLTARDRAWTNLNADPEWTRLQPRFGSYRFGLYQLESGDPARSGS